MSIQKQRLLDTFIKYAATSSGTQNERALADIIKADLAAFSYDVYEDTAGKACGSNAGNIYFTSPGEPGAEPLLFSSHMDTVSPCENVEPVIRDGYVYSKGDTILGADDKAGIAAIVEAMRVVKEKGLKHRPIEAVFTICEEIGLLGSQHIEYDRLKAKQAVICDSSGDIGRIVTSAPGQNRIIANITGKPAHAGSAPENGVSALIAGAEAIANMKLLRIDEETTANIGIFKSLGSTNVVSMEAYIEGEARSRDQAKLDKQTAHMEEEFRKACAKHGAALDLQVIPCYKTYKHAEGEPLLDLIESKMVSLGCTILREPTGGGSDANIFNCNGIKAVTVGTGMDSEHTLNERLSIQNLTRLAEVMLALMVIE
ncbi:M20/M25/M40 family metallo-hydrolase [Oscillospiraceae bacterium OttesenSCG-928-G22]|nr:M20/M25/M40 family metallo-hydrolase [Oscillospiraceae bacterium OttesenSCG-928-G22]